MREKEFLVLHVHKYMDLFVTRIINEGVFCLSEIANDKEFLGHQR